MLKNCLSIAVAAAVRERNAEISKSQRAHRVNAGAWRARCAAALISCWAVSGAYAGSTMYSGSVSGSWSGPPGLKGDLEDGATRNLQTGTPGTETPADNTNTAQCNIGCPLSLPGSPATMLAWGNGAFAPPVTSTLSFAGANFSNQLSSAFGQPLNSFLLGTFTYENGDSDTDSVIFGATLTLTVNNTANGLIATQTIPLQITTVTNDGTSAQNADFVEFLGTTTTLDKVSMNVDEGATASFKLYGGIVGDPTLELTQLVIAPGSESSGFVGNGAIAPEPGTYVLLGAGFAGLALLRRARRSSRGATVLPVS